MLALLRSAKYKVTGFVGRVVGVLDGRRMIVVKDLRCLRKADAMLLLVLTSLLRVPFEYQHCASNSNLTYRISGPRRRAKPAGAGPLHAGVRPHLPPLLVLVHPEPLRHLRWPQ